VKQITKFSPACDDFICSVKIKKEICKDCYRNEDVRIVCKRQIIAPGRLRLVHRLWVCKDYKQAV
jgi:hypothetical protein